MKVERALGQAKKEESEGKQLLGPVGRWWNLQVWVRLFFSSRNWIISSFCVIQFHCFMSSSFSFKRWSIRSSVSLPDLPARSPLCSFGVVFSCRWVIWRRRGKGSVEGRLWGGLGTFVGGGKGVLALAEEEAKGLLSEVFTFCLILLILPDCSFTILWLSLAFVTDPFFLSFPGTPFVKEGQWTERRGTETRDRGTTKITISCGRIRGRGFVQAL